MIRRTLWKIQRWISDYEEEVAVNRLAVPGRKVRRAELVTASDCEESVDLPDPITFRVQAVQGGTIVETRWYDRKRDEQERRLHIVTPDENLSEAIGKIATMELIRK